jgi:hypothetical protein
MRSQHVTRQLPFRLLSNSRDFLERAVEELDGWRSCVSTSVVIHSITAIELILKARLALEDPALIARDAKQPDATSLESPRFRSIDINEAVKRLHERGLFRLTEHQQTQLGLLRRVRNRVIHHVDMTGEPRVEAAVGAELDLWIEVHDSAFHGDEIHRARPMMEIIGDLVRFQPFVTERTNRLKKTLEESVRPLTYYFDECQTCLQHATVLLQDRMRCLFCGHDESIPGWAEIISDDGSVEPCGRCGYRSMVKHRWPSEEASIVCICCGAYRGRRVVWCDVSGRPLPYLKDGVIGPPISAEPLPRIVSNELTRGGSDA